MKHVRKINEIDMFINISLLLSNISIIFVGISIIHSNKNHRFSHLSSLTIKPFKLKRVQLLSIHQRTTFIHISIMDAYNETVINELDLNNNEPQEQCSTGEEQCSTEQAQGHKEAIDRTGITNRRAYQPSYVFFNKWP